MHFNLKLHEAMDSPELGSPLAALIQDWIKVFPLLSGFFHRITVPEESDFRFDRAPLFRWFHTASQFCELWAILFGER
jgi:hypothetical protein